MDTQREDPRESDSQDLVVVGTYSENISAEAVRSCLEMDEIEAKVFDGLISATVYNNVFGGVKVMVRKCDEARARAILASLDTSLSEDVVATQDEITPGGVHCQNCHSLQVRSRAFWKLPPDPLQRLLARWFSHTIVTRCRRCGYVTRS